MQLSRCNASSTKEAVDLRPSWDQPTRHGCTLKHSLQTPRQDYLPGDNFAYLSKEVLAAMLSAVGSELYNTGTVRN
jgi:hypothetical protein